MKINSLANRQSVNYENQQFREILDNDDGDDEDGDDGEE